MLSVCVTYTFHTPCKSYAWCLGLRLKIHQQLIFSHVNFFLFSSKICTDSRLKNQLQDVCIELRNKVHKTSEYSYSDDVVKSKTECLKDCGIDLKDRRTMGLLRRFDRQVGICRFSAGDARCVTKGPEENTIYYYNYRRVINLCWDAQEMTYTFSTSSGKGWFSFLYRFKCWWWLMKWWLKLFVNYTLLLYTVWKILIKNK